MTLEEQRDWLDKRLHDHYTWAAEEYEIRRQAARVVKRLYGDDGPTYVDVYLMLPGDAFGGLYTSTTRIWKHDVARIGGLEGHLVVEEIIRRGRGMSYEHRAEEALLAARAALK